MNAQNIDAFDFKAGRFQFVDDPAQRARGISTRKNLLQIISQLQPVELVNELAHVFIHEQSPKILFSCRHY